MTELPDPRTYELEMKYFPWGELIEKVAYVVEKRAPKNAKVLDLMCGPGFLLGQIEKRRPDLHLEGIDNDSRFIEYARSKYREISFEVVDVLQSLPNKTYDVVMCTGGVHHLPYNRQGDFIKRASGLLNPKGIAIFADPVVEFFKDEKERKRVAAKLGYEYLDTVIQKDAPKEIIQSATDILFNDAVGIEFKTYLQRMEVLLRECFSTVDTRKTWPTLLQSCTSFSLSGDYYFVCENPSLK